MEKTKLFDLDLADVKPSLLSFIIVGLMALLFLAVLKWAMIQWPVPGLSDLVFGVLGTTQNS